MLSLLDPAPAASSSGPSIPVFPTPQGSWIPPWAWQIMAGFCSLWVVASFIGIAFPHTRIGRVCRRWSLDVTDMVSVLRTGKHIDKPPISDPPPAPEAKPPTNHAPEHAPTPAVAPPAAPVDDETETPPDTKKP